MGVITFNPTTNHHGTVTFPYTISDGNGGVDAGVKAVKRITGTSATMERPKLATTQQQQ